MCTVHAKIVCAPFIRQRAYRSMCSCVLHKSGCCHHTKGNSHVLYVRHHALHVSVLGPKTFRHVKRHYNCIQQFICGKHTYFGQFTCTVAGKCMIFVQGPVFINKLKCVDNHENCALYLDSWLGYRANSTGACPLWPSELL
jgi:hypothetical protein